jgi:hypothetical protein
MAGNAEHSLALRSNAISVRSGQRGGIGVDGVPLIGFVLRGLSLRDLSAAVHRQLEHAPA